jgi:hypothetical protein
MIVKMKDINTALNILLYLIFVYKYKYIPMNII